MGAGERKGEGIDKEWGCSEKNAQCGSVRMRMLLLDYPRTVLLSLSSSLAVGLGV